MQETETGTTSRVTREKDDVDIDDGIDTDIGVNDDDNEFEEDEDKVVVTEVDELEAGDAESDELVDEIEADVAMSNADDPCQRYQHNSEIFGSTEVTTSRAKLELLEEERRLKEMLSDSF